MTPDLIQEQLQDMQNQKLRTVCILPMPRDFRPDSTGNRLDVDYLSEQYFLRYRLAMDEVKRLGMKAWLYDEGGWPSGSATGRVVKSDPSLGAQKLVAERGPLAPEGGVSVPPGAVAAFRESRDVLVVCRVQRSDFEPDRLNPAATRRFIELTHEGYRRVMPEYLGSLMPWTFTDEPGVASFVPGKQIPWTDALPAVFRKQKGYDLIATLPLLLSNPPLDTPEAQQARIDFFDVFTNLFREAYLLPIREWCRRYGMLSGGHFNGDNVTMSSARGGELRALRGLDLPGVDTIWRQIFPGQRNHHFPRYAGSVGRQNDRHLVLTESFCVYGNGLSLAEMKWITDYQFVRGCNVLVMGNYPAGTSGNLITGERPHLGPMSPQWRHQYLFQDYGARLGYILSLGEAATDVALYYPERDFWAATSDEATPESRANDDVALALEQHQVDFDIVDDDLLLAESVSHGAIHAGKMSYRTLVMSRTRLVSDATAAAVADFVRGGGTLVLVDSLPQTGPLARRSFLAHLSCRPLRMGEQRKLGNGLVVLTAQEHLPSWVHPALGLQPTTEALRVTARRLREGMLYFITNESKVWLSAVPATGTAQVLKLCNADTGEITLAPQTIRIAPWGSVCLLADRRSDAPQIIEADESNATVLDGAWQIRRLSQTVIEAGDYARRAVSSDAWRSAALGDWKEWVGEDFSGTAEYRLSFTYSGVSAEDKFVDLGRLAGSAEVWLNGQNLGVHAWSPWRFRTRRALRPGVNELRIQVTNTLANYLSSPHVRALWASMKGPGWPSPYDEQAYKFEKESTSSGIFGPVRLLGVIH